MLELLRRDVDCDDPLGAAQHCALDGGEPDAAAADHGDGGALLHRRGPEGGSRTRRKPAGEQRRLLDRQLLGHLHRAGLVDDRLVGERPAAQHRSQQRAVGRPVEAPLRAKLRRAAAGIAPPALRAVAARGAPRDDDAVARRNEGHVAPDLLDDSRALVPEQDREPHVPALRLDDVEVGVAQPAGEDANEHLARAWRIDGQLLDSRRRVGLRVDDATCHDARRSCSSSGTSCNLNVSAALGSVTTLSPSSSIVS